MKCIFVASTYNFSVQYHTWAAVDAHAEHDWPIIMEGTSALYRMLAESGRDRQSDTSCAVFVPAQLNARAAGLLFAAFTAAHLGVIPRDPEFEFNPLSTGRLNRLQHWPKSKWVRFKRAANAHWW